MTIQIVENILLGGAALIAFVGFVFIAMVVACDTAGPR
jgi:hypothetical protein